MTHSADPKFDDRVRFRLDFADAAFAITNGSIGTEEHRRLMQLVASELMTADEAVSRTVAAYGVVIDDARRHVIREWGDYEIPGAATLQSRIVDDENPLGIADPDRFRMIEQDISRLRLIELVIDPVVGIFDYDHMKEIHRRIFQDIYVWAGRERFGPSTAMTRWARDAIHFPPGDPSAPMIEYTYHAGPDIAEATSTQFAQLTHLSKRTNLTRGQLLDLMAEHGAELQSIHPFRDGNSRALWTYGVQFDEHIGYPVDPAQLLSGSPLWQQVLHSNHQYQATGDHRAFTRTLDIGLAQTASPPVRVSPHQG